jgi:transcriptional regulator of acetoin/glycerol metabolism
LSCFEEPPVTNPLDAARAAFVDGEALPASLLPASVARSWVRSRDTGLRPWHAPHYEPPVALNRESALDANRQLQKCVADEVEQLWRAFGGDAWAIFCVNTQGAIVHARRSPDCREPVLQSIVAGGRIHERDIGTTAPSCAIHDGTEIVVAGAQHYLREFENIFCLAVPLFGVDGEVIGALDITGVGQRDASTLREHFRVAGQTIQQRLFAALRHCHLLQIQHDPRWLGTPMSGVIAVEDEGVVRAVSRPARRMLALPADGPLPTLELRQLFGDAPPAVRRRLLRPTHTPLRVACSDGSHLWVRCVRLPLQTSPSVVAPAPAAVAPEYDAARQASLLEHTLETIERTLHEHDGNIAAAARQLRISRTTLYAKLRRLRQSGITSSRY